MTDRITPAELAEIKALCAETARELREMLPPKVNYGELVCAEGGYGSHYVWTEPEPYIIDNAANLIDRLMSEVEAQAAEIETLRREKEATNAIGTWKPIIWVDDFEKVHRAGYRCSCCRSTYAAKTNRCPWCGAKMRGPAAEGEEKHDA